MLTFYHCPGTRSGSVHWLLEELGVPFETEIVPVQADDGAPESYRAIQPNKKVPAIVHDGVLDPVIAAKFGSWTYDKRGVSFGAFDDMVANLNRALEESPYLTGDAF